MNYQPILPGTGLVGWKLLNRTMETQQAALNQSAEITRDTAYFEANIASVETAEQLVDDPRLLRVALGAYGLQDDLDNRYFIRKILEEGTRETDALANKMADDRYTQFAAAFGFDQFSGANTYSPAFAREVVDRFNRASFEQAVGIQDEALRIALYADRALPELATDNSATEDSRWFTVMGVPALRQMFQTALHLPDSFSQLDLDRQLDVFREKSHTRFGVSEVADFADPEVRERLVEQYLLQRQLKESTAYSGMSVALTLLQNSPRQA
ncbi:DUF1217 domain-containing protein [Marinovum sp.]|uniref:DUF1217 domain-containing protein n=1 Tax=Marinovum sp. TaxID=2024839 RepID=UPI002B2723E3|nr:DUF1217 domain-containing protein [Marinovum sp.]